MIFGENGVGGHNSNVRKKGGKQRLSCGEELGKKKTRRRREY
jgi:hypothetical protein